MSLLIDALKKAEEAKRRAAASGDPSRTEPGAEANVESVPRDAAEPAAERRAPADEAALAESARNLFAVKAPRRRVSFALGVGLLTFTASAAIATYFWLQLRPSGPRVRLPPQALDATPRPREALPPATEELSIARPEPVVTVRRAAPPAQSPGPEQGAPSRGSLGESAPLATPAPMAPPTPQKAPIPVVRRSQAPVVPPALAEAWAAYQADQLARAEALYREVLADDERNVDALNGMAAIALRGGRRAEAADWFRRSLEAQPGNAAAIAGLAGAQPRDERGSAESRLRGLIAARPSEAALHFALGNILAADRRWAEAQGSYFRAYDLDRENPDFLFNLAVSLDQLGQRGPARRFYGEALRTAAHRPHAFARPAAEARLGALDAR